MKKFILLLVIAAGVTACNKDKFTTQPQVVINSFGPSVVDHVGQVFSLKATVRDKEGDLQDSLYLVRKIFNGQSLLGTDTLPYSLSNFGFANNPQIQIEADFIYGQQVPGRYITQNTELKDRNFSVGIIVVDVAGNRSSYVESSQIVLKKP